MTDSERIEKLEKTVSALRDALVGLASGGMLAIDWETGNPCLVAGYSKGLNVVNNLVATPCNGSPYQHHYRMESGLCACQDHTWAR